MKLWPLPHASASLTLSLIAATSLFAQAPAKTPKSPQPPKPIAGASSAAGAPSAASYGKLPLSFEANRGQTDPSVQYLSHGQGYTLFLRPGEAVLELGGQPSGNSPAGRSSTVSSTSSVSMTLAGANPKAAVTHEDPQITRTNYFLGKDPARWQTDVPNYGRVRYTGVYDGIDLVYYGNQRQLEHDFIVAPGADPAKIALMLTGAGKLRIDPRTGDLVLSTGTGVSDLPKPDLRLLKPVTYQQQADGKRIPVLSSYRLLADNKVGFQIGAYNHAQPLIIDPVLVYSTYLGGSGVTGGFGDQANGIAVDDTGAAYLVGTTFSLDFPVLGAYQAINRGGNSPQSSNVFVSKLNPAGTALIFSTYIGGSASRFSSTYAGDVGNGIAVDPAGDVYITGNTTNTDFPVTSGALISTKNDLIDGFVTKFNSSGSALIYSTYLGGVTPVSYTKAVSTAILVNSAGNAYVTGSTSAPTFPTTAGVYQHAIASTNAPNAFITELNTTGTGLVFSTFLGGAYNGTGPSSAAFGDQANAIALDSTGNVYVAGFTYSGHFPLSPTAFQRTNYGLRNYGGDGFISKLNPTGTKLLYSTLLGGSVQYNVYPSIGPHPNFADAVNALAVDASGDAYVAGTSWSSDFPVTANAFQPTGDYTRGTGYVAKLKPDATGLLYSTYLNNGGTARGLVVDALDAAYVTGSAPAAALPKTLDAVASTGDAFLIKFSPSGEALDFGTPLGGTNGAGDAGTAIALGLDGSVYVTGLVHSPNFPTTAGAFQTGNNGTANSASNAFVANLAVSADTTDHFPTQTALTLSSAAPKVHQALTLTAVVSTSSGASVPTGTVTFIETPYNSPTPISQTATLDGTGTAHVTVSTLLDGGYSVYAAYSADATHVASLSSLSNLVVYGPPASVEIYFNEDALAYGYPMFASVAVLDSAKDVLAGVHVNVTGANMTFSPATVITTPIAQGVAGTYGTGHKIGPVTVTATVSGTSVTGTTMVTVYPVYLTVDMDDRARSYGAANPAVRPSFFGLVLGDVLTVTQSTPATSSSPVGTYPVNGTVSGAAASNYVITVVPGHLTVLQAPLSIVARSETVSYGQTPAPPTAYTLTGFVNGDTAAVVSGAAALSTTVTSTTPVGSYKIGVLPGTLSAANYFFQPAPNGSGSVVVAKAALTLAPVNVTINQGDPIPTFAYTLTGFVNGDTAASSVTGAPVITTTATSSSPAGHYTITVGQGTLASPSYTFNKTPGLLTINR